ncbi:MAG: phenylalanine--tRNA ligase subunit beta [Fusobacteriaceae bacterium]
MLISLDWLKQYVEIKEETKDLEKALTMIGQEVEGIEIQGKDLENVVIGQVVEFLKHPEAEKLTLLKVSVGEEKELQIVCGAPNHKLGDKVVVAKIGAILPGDFKIKKSKIRGIESEGMLCSEVELGLGKDGDGIIILPEEAEIGLEYRTYLGLNDIIFELEITPNRPDCLSHIGIAREVAAYYRRNIKYPSHNLNEVMETVENIMNVKIENKEKCPVYMGRYIKNVKIQESPEWLKKRINAMGLKSINNIVDLTNFVMFEYNQPIHAFDADKISENSIVVRNANPGEKIVTLDGIERELQGELVIADIEKPIAIAGIIGGKNSEVDENTTNIFLEVAYFTPENIRKTSKNIGVSTDSSYRFERGTDSQSLETVLERIASLIENNCGGEILKGKILESSKNHEKIEIPLSISKLNSFVGKKIPFDEIGSILTNLNLEIKTIDMNHLIVTPPSYRGDLTRTEDLYEEVIRMYGFENIEAIMPKEDITPGKKDKNIELVDNTKEILKNIGLQEVINYSFISKQAIETMGIKEKTIEVLNPINEDFMVMRPTLMYSLLANIRDNFNRNQDDLKFYEVSKVFLPSEQLANEEYRVAIALSGKKMRTLWNSKPESYDFYSIKGYIESFLEKMGISKYSLVRTENNNFHPGRAADIYIGRELIGSFGEIHPDLAEKMDIKRDRAYIGELNLNLISKYSKNKIKYEKIIKYPEVTRDLAILLNEKVFVGDMVGEVKKISTFIEKVNIFDIYQGANIEKGKKSVAIGLVFRKSTGTLEEKEIAEIIEKILELIGKKYDGQMRQA